VLLGDQSSDGERSLLRTCAPDLEVCPDPAIVMSPRMRIESSGTLSLGLRTRRKNNRASFALRIRAHLPSSAMTCLTQELTRAYKDAGQISSPSPQRLAAGCGLLHRRS
jgi:hypothetical protein